MSGRQEIKALIREMRPLGWEVEPTGGCHLRWRHPLAKRCVISSATPSCQFAIKKIRAELARVMPEEVS